MAESRLNVAIDLADFEPDIVPVFEPWLDLLS